MVGGVVMEENNNAHTKYEVKIEMCYKQNRNPLGEESRGAVKISEMYWKV